MTSDNESPFAEGFEPIFVYTRDQAIEDGVLVDVTDLAREAGFKYPTAVTCGVWNAVVSIPRHSAAQGESEKGRLWDIFTMLHHAISASRSSTDTVHFRVLATNERGRRVTHRLWSRCGPGDTPAPVITIMLEGED